jgi:hypothetical protein
VALNRTLDLATAQELAKTFLEIVICPGIDGDAAARLARRERLRVLVLDRPDCAAAYDVRSLSGGLLVQTRDRVSADRASMTVASKRQPTEAEWGDLLVAWKVCRHVKSNAIVIVGDRMALGVGAGQMSRVEAAELAVARAGDRVTGTVAASDAFFPLPDGLETLGRGRRRHTPWGVQERRRGHRRGRRPRDGDRAYGRAPLPPLNAAPRPPRAASARPPARSRTSVRSLALLLASLPCSYLCSELLP